MLDEVLRGALAGIVGGAVGGGLVAVFVVLLVPRKKCPDCGAHLPKIRNRWRSLRIPWQCPACGCSVDNKGQAVRT
jgi:hypothetical protein